MSQERTLFLYMSHITANNIPYHTKSILPLPKLKDSFEMYFLLAYFNTKKAAREMTGFNS